MLNIIESKIKNLSDEELKECYDSILKYNEQGVMGESLVRKIRTEIALSIGDKTWDVDCRSAIIPQILLEIARRYYKN